MSLFQLCLPNQPKRLFRKAQPILGGVTITPAEVTNALVNTAVRYGPILTLKDAAQIARVAPGALKRWVGERRFRKSVKQGKPLLFWRDRFLAEVMR